MNITYSDKNIATTQAQALVFFLEQDFHFSEQLHEVAETYFPTLQEFLEQEDFKGKKKQFVSISVAAGRGVRQLIFVGLGKKEDLHPIDIEVYRRALGSVVKGVQRKKVESVAIKLPHSALFNVSPVYLAEQTTTIIAIALYAFDEFFSQDSAKVKKDINFELVAESDLKTEIEKGIAQGLIIGDAVNKSRYWIDMPPSKLTPVELAEKATGIAKKYGLKATVFSEKDIIKMGMGGLAGVSAGSEQDCKFVILEYKSGKKDAPTLAYVGKGITFDSGGLSIKPASGMESMKDDMSGAAAVIATMQAIAQLKPEVNVVGITPLSENLPSGTATKPGDILTFYNGKTAEVLNTDAEGRLVLADGLAYAAKEFKPDVIVDIATLTGLCQYFFGPYYTALYSKYTPLVDRIEHAAKIAGERVWHVPYDDDYKDAVKSNYADIKNIGSPAIKAGTITAACFLEHFVDDVPWAHLDIAGTSFDVPNISYFNTGATGAGVRLLTELAMNWNKNE